MSLFSSVLCALDSSPLAPRVLRHAIGIAGAFGAKLSILTVVNKDAHQAELKIASLLKDVLPPGATYVGQPTTLGMQLVMGQAVDAIVDAAGDSTDLIVAGTHSKSGLASWFLGSTSAQLLEQAACPVLLVPPGDVDIVAIDATSARLTPGAVLGAVDLSDINERQLTVAAEVAAVASQPLTLMTVAETSLADAAAEQALAELARRVGASARTLVRHGTVAAEIDRAAVAEHAGLVVMGLRAVDRGTPGAIATAVLKQKDALVLAVPAR
ncbi:MAG: universal stress protein [Vicinamibacterales bacterium]